MVAFELWDLTTDLPSGCCLASGFLKTDSSRLLQDDRVSKVVDLEGQGNLDGKTAKLSTSFMLVRQPGSGDADLPTDQWTSHTDTAGQRAIHLDKLHKGWAVVPPPGLQKSVAVARQLRQNLMVSPYPALCTV